MKMAYYSLICDINSDYIQEYLFSSLWQMKKTKKNIALGVINWIN